MSGRGARVTTWQSERRGGCERKAELVERWGPQTLGLAVSDELATRGRDSKRERLTYLTRRLNSTPLLYSASLESQMVYCK